MSICQNYLDRSVSRIALFGNFQAGVSQLMVAVDPRNRPARQLCEKMAFVLVDERELPLFFFMDLAAGPPSSSRNLPQITS